VLQRAFFYFLCTVIGCDGGNRTRNIAVYTWRSPLSYDRHPKLRPSPFKEIFAEVVAPHGRLPVGSVVLVGSLSHLGTFGLESYTNDLVKTISSMSAMVGQGVNVVTYVPVPLGGIDDPVTIRALFDLDSWLKADPGLTLGGAREFFWGAVAANGDSGGASSNGERRYHLPAGTVTPERNCIAHWPSVPPCRIQFSPWTQMMRRNWLVSS
jgi:hypothetical protein